MIEDPKALRPGTVLRYLGPIGRSDKKTVTLRCRKADGSGWWNTDGSGLADVVLAESDAWEIHPLTKHRIVRADINRVLHQGLGFAGLACESACTHYVTGTWTALGIANVIMRASEREEP